MNYYNSFWHNKPAKVKAKKITHGFMKAHDMFIQGAKQVFCRKTGDYICLEGQEVKELFTPIKEEEKIITNPYQINLF